MRWIMKIATAGMALALLASAVRAEEVKDIEQKIIDASKDLKSMKGDINFSSDMSQRGMTMEIRGKGTVEFMKTGEGENEQTLSRMDLQQKMSMKMGESGGQEMESKMQMITDKDYTYVLNEQNGQKQAFKRKPDKTNPGAPTQAMFDALQEQFNLSYKGEEKVDDAETYVIEAKPKQESENITKQDFYFGKKDGILRKMVVYGPEDKPIQTMTITNIQRNVKINPDRFKFVPPEGVSVMDMSQMGAPQTQQGKSESKGETEKKGESQNENKTE